MQREKTYQAMNEVSQTIATVKRQLKAQGLTYKDVAAALKLSETSVKRVFSRERFTVGRLAQIARLLGFTLAELLAESAAEVPQLHFLTADKEAKLVGDPKLLLVTVCALNRWTAAEISGEYRLTQAEVLKYLLVLDRMGLIELLPGDRVRPLVARDFDWLPAGPIRRYFMDHALGDFLGSRFGDVEETLEFVHGLMTEAALSQLRQELRRLRARMAVLHDESTAAPLAQRRGIGLVLALRRWEPESFQRLRRVPATRGRHAPQRKDG